MKKFTLIIIIILVFLATSVFAFSILKYFFSPIPRNISEFELSIHNSKFSCYVMIDGNVYDITNFISKHNGGDEIVKTCGHNIDDEEMRALLFGRFTPVYVTREMVVEKIKEYYIGKFEK